jgi:phage shock protein E
MPRFPRRRSILVGLVAAAVTAGLVTAGCTDAGPNGNNPENLVAEHVSVAKFADEIAKGAVVIDVRTPNEFTSQRIDGAKNISLDAPDFTQRIGELDKSARYAVYCESGVRSSEAVKRLNAAGFEHAFYLEGGLEDWNLAGKPVTSG